MDQYRYFDDATFRKSVKLSSNEGNDNCFSEAKSDYLMLGNVLQYHCVLKVIYVAWIGDASSPAISIWYCWLRSTQFGFAA